MRQEPSNHQVLSPWEANQAAYERQISSWKIQAACDRKRTSSLPDSSAQQVVEAATRQTPEQSLGRVYSRVLQWVLDQPQQLSAFFIEFESSDQTSYKVENGSEVISYKLIDTEASEAFHASDALATPVAFDSFVAFVQQHQPIKSVSETSGSSNSETIDQISYQVENGPGHISYMKRNAPKDTQHQSANDLASAKVICYINSIENDFVSAEVIAAPNGPANDRSAYDHLADTPSFTDTSPFSYIALNDLASAKIISSDNFIAIDFVSAEVIATNFSANGVASATVISTSTLNGPAYHQSADMLSSTDTPSPPPYKSDESDQTPLSYTSDRVLISPHSSHQTLNGPLHASIKSEEFSSFFSVSKLAREDQIKINLFNV